LRLALSEYVAHYHAERNHQGKDNVLLFPRDTQMRRGGPMQGRERLGGLLYYYHQEAAYPGGRVSDDEVDCTCARTTMLLANAQVSPNITRAVDRQSHEGLGNNQSASIPWIGALEPDQYFDHRIETPLIVGPQQLSSSEGPQQLSSSEGATLNAAYEGWRKSATRPQTHCKTPSTP
jgi:hypothetical protein